MGPTKIMKDGEVEVSSEEEGFIGAWFRAILEENPTNSNRQKLRVRYLTLLDNDGSSPLIEHIEPRFIRPVPPDNLHKGDVFEEGLVVDADHNDGWWTGVVIKKMEDDNYLVYFDSPVPDILQLERKQLRAHLSWIDSTWSLPDIKELGKSMFSSGTMVEVSSIKHRSTWLPSMIVKEIGDDDTKKFIVKDWNKYLRCNGDAANTTIGSRWVRPTPPPSSVDKYTLFQNVEAFCGSRWHKGRVMGFCPDKRYKVRLEGTKQKSKFKLSDLRPFMEWENGVWHKDPKPKPVEGTPCKVLERKLTSSCSGAKPMTPKRATKAETVAAKPVKGTPSKVVERNLTSSCSGAKPMTPKMATKAETVAPKPVKGTPSKVLERKLTSSCSGAKPMTLIDPKAKPVKVTPSNVYRRKLTSSCSGAKPMTPKRENKAVSSTPQKTREEENTKDKSRKRKREEKHNSDVEETAEEAASAPVAVITATPLKQIEAETESNKSPKKTLELMKNQNGVESSSTPQKTPEEENTKDKSRKRKREEKHNSDVKETDGTTCNGSKAEIDGTERPSDQRPNVVDTCAADVEETRAKGALMIMPFAKTLPFWKNHETGEMVPQNPHFCPLAEVKEDMREWSAVGMMVGYNGLVKKVEDLQLDVSSSELSRLSSSLAELEKYGFDVATHQSRINKVLSLQDGRAKKVEERKCLEEKIVAKEMEKHKIKEEKAELERKILELNRREAAADEEIVEMKSCAETIDQEIADGKLECTK